MGEEIVKSNRVYLWDNLKILLITFVVIHHASIPYVVIKGQHWTEDLYMLIMPYTMSTFTIISGYWFKPRPLDVLVKRYLLPCMLMIFLIYGIRSFEPNAPSLQYYRWRLDILWYLWVLFFYCLITPRLLKCNLNVLLASSVLLSLVAGFFPSIGGAFALSRMIGFYPFFLLGIKMRDSSQFNKWLNDKKAVRWARIIFITIMVLYFAFFCFNRGIHLFISFSHHYDGNWHAMPYRLFTYLVCAALSVALIVSMPNKQYWFTKYGSRSMTPYILHPLLLYIFSFNLAIPIMDKWYGYVFYMLVIPALSMMTVHSRIDGFVKKLTS